MRRIAAVTTLAVAVLALAGYAESGPPPSAGGQFDRPVAVLLQRTGGIAGIRDEVTVQPDGSWQRTSRTGAIGGRLPADQNDTLTRMAADPRLRAEAARTVPESECADAFEYSLTLGATRIAWQDCVPPTEFPAAAGRIARFLLESTNSK